MDRVSTLALNNALAVGATYHGKVAVQIAIMALFAANPGELYSIAQLTDFIWGDDPDGGPIDPGDCIRIAILKLRKKGHAVRSHGSGRYSYDPWRNA